MLERDASVDAATALGYTIDGEPRLSEASVVRARQADGTLVVVRVSYDIQVATRSALIAELFADGTLVRAPRLLAQYEADDTSIIQVWEHLEAAELPWAGNKEIGAALAMFETYQPAGVPQLAFDPLVPRPSYRLGREVWDMTNDLWTDWTASGVPHGWTHGDWGAGNMNMHNGRLYVWDIGEVGYGPLGWDVATLWIVARYRGQGLRVANARAQGYVAARGLLNIEQVRVDLEPAAAGCAALLCASRAKERPELLPEAELRLNTALNGGIGQWTPLADIVKKPGVMR
jgi:hypothetical protein